MKKFKRYWGSNGKIFHLAPNNLGPNGKEWKKKVHLTPINWGQMENNKNILIIGGQMK